jgi:transposase
MLISGVVLLQDNARPHTAARTRALLEHFNWELFDHPPYSPDLAPSYYHLFPYLKNRLRSQRFSNHELMKGIKMWLSSQAYKNLFHDYDMCLNSGGDYVEKQLKYVRDFYI